MQNNLVPKVLYEKTEVVNNELFSTIQTQVNFTVNDFHLINKKYSPKKELVNRIARAAGIKFSSSVRTDYVKEEFVENGMVINKITGVKCYKQGSKRGPDGEYHKCSPCSYEYNWGDKAEVAFLKDADNIGQTWPNGNPKAKFNFPNDPVKEKRARDIYWRELKMKGERMASTGSELAVIKEIIGLPTSWTKEEVMVGSIWVSQICKSDLNQKLEAQARYKSLSEGKSTAGKISELLGEPDFDNKFERPEPVHHENTDNHVPEPAPVQSNREKYMEDFVKCTDHFKGFLKEQENSMDGSEESYEYLLQIIEDNNYGNQR